MPLSLTCLERCCLAWNCVDTHNSITQSLQDVLRSMPALSQILFFCNSESLWLKQIGVSISSSADWTCKRHSCRTVSFFGSEVSNKMLDVVGMMFDIADFSKAICFLIQEWEKMLWESYRHWLEGNVKTFVVVLRSCSSLKRCNRARSNFQIKWGTPTLAPGSLSSVLMIDVVMGALVSSRPFAEQWKPGRSIQYKLVNSG